jgi:hypothetical protein
MKPTNVFCGQNTDFVMLKQVVLTLTIFLLSLKIVPVIRGNIILMSILHSRQKKLCDKFAFQPKSGLVTVCIVACRTLARNDGK